MAGLLVAVAVAALFGATIYTDWLWFKQLGYGRVFSTMLGARTGLGLGAGGLFAAIVFANLVLARSRMGDGPRRIDLPYGQLLPEGTSRRTLLLLALGVGALAGWSTAANWPIVMKYAHRTTFGIADPVFGRDAGFYLFELPFYSLAYEFLNAALMASLAATAVVYFMGHQIVLSERGLDIYPGARPHLSVLVALLLLTRAAGYRLGLYQLLYSTRGVVFGASYTDVHAQAKALSAMALIAVAAGLFVLASVRARRANAMVLAVLAVVASSLLLGEAYPAFVQQFTVEPNENTLERPYIEHNIRFTRFAFDLEGIAEREFAAADSLDARVLERNAATVQNIRLWDERPLLGAYKQLQALRTYYTFNSVDMDRYVVGGRLRQVSITARELNTEFLPQQTWINVHLQFTHGYGAVVSPVTEIGPEGQPLLWIKDLPPVSSTELVITRPEIYHGELTRGYAVVNTRLAEFDYPKGDENVQTRYAGRGGVRLSSPLVRAAFAARFRSYELLLSGDVTRDSRVLMYRNVVERVARLAPFLRLDRDPYLVISDEGRLFWILDAYTTSRAFPYSEPLPHPVWGDVNYVRNSVKVVIDAYHGDVTFYLFDPADPLVRVWQSIFPGMFVDAARMPADLRRHVRYPLDMFHLQAQQYMKYHMTDPGVFYNQEDLWQVPTEVFLDRSEPVQPYYLIMRLPGEKAPEFLLLQPFSPKEKPNMVAWFAARSDPGPNYGEPVVFRMPKDKLVFGPQLVEGRIDQDAYISQQLTLWNQRGSQVLRGNLLVVPIEDSLLYVEPLYLQSADTKMPELKKVIVGYGNRIAMDDNLELALRRVFGGEAGRPPAGWGEDFTLAQLAGRARELFEQAQRAAQASDWAGYGRLLRDLEDALRRLEQRARAPEGR